MKDKTTAALLAIFLGGLGVHKFYLGRGVAGVLYLLFCWTFIPAFLGLIDGLILLAMGQQEFDSKYNLHALLRSNLPQQQQIAQNIVIQAAPPVQVPATYIQAAPPVQVPATYIQAAPPVQGPVGYAAPPAVAGVSVADELRKLNELRIAGAITDEEFAAHKQKLLSA